jgi:hypothetical protein
MKPRIKQPEQPASRSFWAVHVRSKSGIAHLVTAESTIFLGRETSDTPFFYVSECGRRYAFWEVRTIGSSGIGSPRCKRCMSSTEKERFK